VPGLSEGAFREMICPISRPSKYSPELRERAVRMVLHPGTISGGRSAGAARAYLHAVTDNFSQ
jgi:hypothetical protein